MGLLGLGFKLKNVLKPKKVYETITKVTPLKKIKDQKSVTQVRNDASAALIKATSFNYKEGVKKALKKMKDIK